MKKLILAFLFLTGTIISKSQKKYLCEYSDTITADLPDSVFASILASARPDIEIPEDVMTQFLMQIKQKPLRLTQTRIVRAENNQTIISIDRNSRDGALQTETFDSLLYKNDEIFLDSASANGFAKSPSNRSRKQFVVTGNKLTIINYNCDEYISTDSLCYIWVTNELPDHVNPGIRKGNIKGAVLGFQLKDAAYVTKSVLTRFGRGL